MEKLENYVSQFKLYLKELNDIVLSIRSYKSTHLVTNFNKIIKKFENIHKEIAWMDSEGIKTYMIGKIIPNFSINRIKTNINGHQRSVSLKNKIISVTNEESIE